MNTMFDGYWLVTEKGNPPMIYQVIYYNADENLVIAHSCNNELSWAGTLNNFAEVFSRLYTPHDL